MVFFPVLGETGYKNGDFPFLVLARMGSMAEGSVLKNESCKKLQELTVTQAALDSQHEAFQEYQ